MASVGTSLQLFDQMSQSISTTQNGMNKVLGTAEKLKHSLQKDANINLFNIEINQFQEIPEALTNGFQKVYRVLLLILRTARQIKLSNTGVKQMQDDLKKVTELEEKVSQLQDKLNNKGKQGGSKSSWILDKVKGLAGQYLSFDTIKDLGAKALTGGMEQQKLQDMFKARTGDDQVGTAMFQKFRTDAMKSGVDANEFLTGTLSLLPKVKNTNQLEKLNSMALRLNAFDTEGKGIGDNLSVLKEAMGGNTDSLAERYNMSDASIKASKIEDFGKAGDLNGFINAFDKLLEKENMGKQAFETMLATPAKQIEMLSNNFQTSLAMAGQGALQALQPLLATLNTAFQEGKFEPFFNGLQVGLNVVAWLVTALVNVVLWLSDVIQNNWPMASAILISLGAVIATILIPALWAAITPILAQAAAWLAATWPILLIIAVIGVLIYILLSCGVTAEQIVGSIVGSFMVLYGVVWNVIAQMWNRFASFGDFLINMFIDSTYAGKTLFYDLVVAYGGFLESMVRGVEDFAGVFMKSILQGINGILKGFNWLVDGINNMFGIKINQAKFFDENNVHAISDSMRNMMDQLEKPVSDKNVIVTGRMDYKDLKNEFDFGYSSGATLVNKLSTVQDSMDPNKQKSITDGWNQNTSIDKVGVVGKIDDTVDVSSEDIKVMRDLAELQNIQNFVTLTPTVQVTTGDITNPTDVNEMIRRIEDVMVREIANSAQGVYE
ncbi:hypothetical protein [Paenibacillus sp. RC67]|uniref:phage tail protein n=1 Tax=Paenibacillus sp. RC67 TaxID=3039392 RepID=UPI0024AD92A1|nr:hypothetical protein [Paenibacillus sp. RC67]